MLFSFMLLLQTQNIPPVDYRVTHIGVDQGLSQGNVFDIIQDHSGFMWFATRDGLNRWDGYEMKVFRHDADDPDSLCNNYIYTLMEDSKGHIWVGTKGGLSVLDQQRVRFTSYRYHPEETAGLSHNTIHDLAEDKHGTIWIPTMGGGLNRLDPSTGTFSHYRHDPNNPNSISSDLVTCIFVEDDQLWLRFITGELNSMQLDQPGVFKRYGLSIGGYGSRPNRDSQGRLWVGTKNGPARLENDKIVRDRLGGEERRWSEIIEILFDNTGTAWYASYARGLFQYNPYSNKVRQWLPGRQSSDAIAENQLVSLCQSRDGVIWLGTYGGGVNCLIPTPFDRRFSGRSDTTRAFGETKNGQILVGTDIGLQRYLPNEALIQPVLGPGSEAYPDISPVNYLHEAEEGGFLACSNNNFFYRVKDDSVQKAKISHPLLFRLTTVWESEEKELWFGSMDGDIHVKGPTQERYIKAHPTADGALAGGDVIFIQKSKVNDQRLWIGSFQGLYSMDLDRPGWFTRYEHRKEDSTSLPGNVIFSLYQDGSGLLWLGTASGLSRFDPSSATSENFNLNDGLASNVIYKILADLSGRLWMSTATGISCYDPGIDKFTNYDRYDGVPNTAFYRNSGMTDTYGYLYFGGTGGWTRFHPETLYPDPIKPAIRITNFQLDNQPVLTRDKDPNSPLTLPIEITKQLSVKHTNRTLSFSFATLDYRAPEKNGYMHRLLPFDKDWIHSDAAQRQVTYTNLDPGNYQLWVKGINRGGAESDPIELKITIPPPPWLTWWAKIGYGLLAVVVVAYYSHTQRHKLEWERKERLREQQVSNQLREIDSHKDSFLANTSHELRTPLNGIIGLAESLLDGATGPLPKATKTNLDMIANSGKRLANLVNDLLDFSRLRDKGLDLHGANIDFYLLVEKVLTMTRPLAGEKELSLENAVCPQTPWIYGDEDRLQQVLYNLVGNAVKFTERGHIRVTSELEGKHIKVGIWDTGIGIAKDQLGKIFNSFEQGDGSASRTYGGTGLGLAISQQLIGLHGSQIQATSTLDEGSCFSFYLALADNEESHDHDPVMVTRAPQPKPQHVEQIEMRVQPEDLCTNIGDFSILIVDDDPVNRQVLYNHLSPHPYRLGQASSGPETLRAIGDGNMYDLILLDIMMPGMTGYEVCTELRKRFPSHTLPVIFLTARTQVSDLVTGLEAGANDYLSKPVEKRELLARVKTHLALLDANRNLEEKVSERTAHLVEAQKELVEAAHSAGMAEMAIDVLHNVGNRLNSLSTAIQVLRQTAGNEGGPQLLRKIADLLNQNSQDLGSFLNDDKRGQQLPKTVETIAARFEKQNQILKSETDKLSKHMQAVEEVLQEQRERSTHQVQMDSIDLNETLAGAIRLSGLAMNPEKMAIKVDLQPDLPNVLAKKARLNRVLLYVLSNAAEALKGKDEAEITVTGKARNDRVILTIKDNGSGIPDENQALIFNHGFTTKPGHRGFGLHHCACVLAEMKGAIQAESPGLDQGCQVTLTLTATE